MKKKEADKLLQRVRELEESESTLRQQVDSLRAENEALRQQYSGIGKLLKASNKTVDLLHGELKSAQATLREQGVINQEFRNKYTAAEEFTEEMFQRLEAAISEKRASEAALTSKTKRQEENNETIQDLQKKLSNAQEDIQQQAVESVVDSCILNALFAATLTGKEDTIAEASLVVNEFCLQQLKRSEQLSCNRYLSSSSPALTHSRSTEKKEEGKTDTAFFARFLTFWSVICGFCGKALCCL